MLARRRRPRPRPIVPLLSTSLAVGLPVMPRCVAAGGRQAACAVPPPPVVPPPAVAPPPVVSHRRWSWRRRRSCRRRRRTAGRRAAVVVPLVDVLLVEPLAVDAAAVGRRSPCCRSCRAACSGSASAEPRPAPLASAAADVAAAAWADLDDDVAELLRVGEPAQRVDRQLERLALRGRRLADLPGGGVEVLAADRRWPRRWRSCSATPASAGRARRGCCSRARP